MPEKARWRTFTTQYKQEVPAAYQAAPDGEKGTILRREGLDQIMGINAKECI